MRVNYEYWPPIKGGTQDDPIQGRRHVNDMQGAIIVVDELKSKYGANLRYVDVIIKLFRNQKC